MVAATDCSVRRYRLLRCPPDPVTKMPVHQDFCELYLRWNLRIFSYPVHDQVIHEAGHAYHYSINDQLLREHGAFEDLGRSISRLANKDKRRAVASEQFALAFQYLVSTALKLEPVDIYYIEDLAYGQLVSPRKVWWHTRRPKTKQAAAHFIKHVLKGTSWLK